MAQKDLQHFFEEHLVQTDNNILEVGSGIGRMTKYLLRKYRGSRLTSIDINCDVINMLKKTFRSRDSFQLMCHDASIPLEKKKKFDIIIAFQVYPFLKNPKEVFETLYQDLSDKGVIYFLELDMFKLESNITLPILEKFYNDFKKGMEFFGCHYDFNILENYLDYHTMELERVLFIKEEKIEISEPFLNMFQSFSVESDYFLETFEFYYQFLNHVGWLRKETFQFFKEFMTYNIYKDYIGELLIKKYPYHLFKISKRT